MAQKPNNLPLIAIAVIAVGALVGLNLMNQKNDPVIQEKIQKDAEKEAAEKAAGKTSSPPPAPAGDVSPEANDVVTWGAEKTFGTPGGKPSVVIGWSWTPAVQANPSSVYTALDTVRTAFPKAAIRVVNVDAKPEAATPGISVDGTVRVSPLADGAFPPKEVISTAVTKPAAAGAK